jgi:hypothetical protein
LTVEPSATWTHPSFATADSTIAQEPLSTGGVEGVVVVEPEPPQAARKRTRTRAGFRIVPIKHCFIFPKKLKVLVLVPARLRAQ